MSLAERFRIEVANRNAPRMNPTSHPVLVTSSLNDIRAVFTYDAAQSACERTPTLRDRSDARINAAMRHIHIHRRVVQ